MIPHSWKTCALIVIFIVYPVKSDTCTLTQMPLVDKCCSAQIDCTHYVRFDVTTWSCIRHVQENTVYDDYGDYPTEETVNYDDNYNLIINVLEPREINLFNVDVGHFTKLTLVNGNIITVPEEIYRMTQLEEINISGTKIRIINLNSFISMPRLKKIKLAKNTIIHIEVNEGNNATFNGKLSTAEVIDISHNAIEIIPNNCMLYFTQLQHLNLSHNLISSIGLLTFEGIIQLKILDISHNRLLEIGNAFARFIHLTELLISNNNLTILLDYNFVSLTNLEKLNISSNNISIIENNSFMSLAKLEFLDLSHNHIELITKQLVSNNVNLHSFLLMDNQIQSIEANSFENMSISEFSIQNNRLRGAIEKSTFKGVNVTELDLSHGDISSIKDGAFTDMIELRNLNLSFNSISNISRLAFSSLVALQILDLSHNKVNELNFESVGLQNLSKLYVQHNGIEKIRKHVFDNFLSLTELDLSSNDIKEIEPQSFSKVTKVMLIKFNNCHFVNSLESKVFQGLSSLQRIDMSGTRTQRYKNGSFIGLTALTYIHSAFGQLTDIEYNAFLGTGSVQILELSNNQLYSFYVNSSTLSKIQEIYLNNNYITNIPSETFSKMTFLRKLNLANNDIKQLSSNVFRYLNELVYIDLSSNLRMKIIGNPFQNLSKINSLSLEKVQTDVTFQNSSAFIEVLDMQSCSISNLNNIYIFNVKGLNYLNLSMNEITSINKDSFRNMSTLVSLDLSLNKIINIQPGSFLHFRGLIKLSLFQNSLPSIQFGVFDGTEVLRELDISSNMLNDFDVKLLQSPVIERLSLDDNIITNLNFIDFLNTKILKLSVGGNQISCKNLAELKNSKYAENFKEIVTAKTLNYHSENVNGISCQTFTKNTTGVVPVSENSSIDIIPLMSSIKNAIGKFDQISQAISENTNKADELGKNAKSFINIFEKIIKSNNTSEIASIEYLTKLVNVNNNSNIQLGEIKEYVKNLTEYKKYLVKKNEENNTNILNDQHTRLFETILKKETDALSQEFKNALTNTNIGNSKPVHEYLVTPASNSNDSKAVFYFIAVCLAVMLAAYLGNLVYSHVTKLRRSTSAYTRNSANSISNNIEME